MLSSVLTSLFPPVLMAPESIQANRRSIALPDSPIEAGLLSQMSNKMFPRLTMRERPALRAWEA